MFNTPWSVRDKALIFNLIRNDLTPFKSFDGLVNAFNATAETTRTAGSVRYHLRSLMTAGTIPAWSRTPLRILFRSFDAMNNNNTPKRRQLKPTKRPLRRSFKANVDERITMPHPEWVTEAEGAALFKCSDTIIRQRARKGKVRKAYIANQWDCAMFVYNLTDLQTWAKNRVKPLAPAPAPVVALPFAPLAVAPTTMDTTVVALLQQMQEMNKTMSAVIEMMAKK